MNNKLIYGKNTLERIVSIEDNDSHLEVIRELEDGTVKSEFLPNKYWIVAPRKIDESWVRLKGDLYYKYGKQFSERREFMSAKQCNKKNDVFSIYNGKESAMVKDGYTYFKGMKPKEVSVLSFDIEGLGLLEQRECKVFLISNTFRKNDKVTKKLFDIKDYGGNEGQMLTAWCSWVREVNPSIFVGHNIYGYDFPYLDKCASNNNISLSLGRDGSKIKFNPYESKFRVDGSQDWKFNECHIYGREIIDTMFLSVKYDFGRSFPNWKLKDIIEYLGYEKEGRIKWDFTEHPIKEFYNNDEMWQKFREYCIDDGDDALALFDLMIPSYFYLSQSIPKPFSQMINKATGSQMNSLMIRAYLQDMHSLPRATEAEKYEGAISFGNAGNYRNVVKYDVASLYPSIMRHYEVCDDYKDPKRFFPTLVEYFTIERLRNKGLAKSTGEQYYTDLEQAQKICINSFYGFLGAPGLLFNSPRNAAFVTERGRHILRKGIEWAEGKGFQIVNVDTDSFSFTENGRPIDEEEKLELLKDLNTLYPELIVWDDDGSYDAVLVVKAKNYALYDGKKVKIKGSSLKATTKEPALKEMIERIIKSFLSLTNEDIHDVYNEYCMEAYNVKDITRWSSKKSVTLNLLKSDRTNETKVLAALEGEDYDVGDKFFVFFKEDDSVCLSKNYNGDYSKDRMLEKVFKTMKTFDSVYNLKEHNCLNYKLKRNREALEGLVNV